MNIYEQLEFSFMKKSDDLEDFIGLLDDTKLPVIVQEDIKLISKWKPLLDFTDMDCKAVPKNQQLECARHLEKEEQLLKLKGCDVATAKLVIPSIRRMYPR